MGVGCVELEGLGHLWSATWVGLACGMGLLQHRCANVRLVCWRLLGAKLLSLLKGS